MRRVIILGSTGSVGANALDVARSLPDRFRVVGLSANTSAAAIVRQAAEFRVEAIAVEDATAAGEAETLARAQGLKLRVFAGAGAALALMDAIDSDVLVQSTVGAAALRTTLAALERGGICALANKESLVMAGPLLLATAKRCGATLVPVDSEHSAIYQCLRSGRADEVERILLTTSGGAFRDRPIEELAHATPAEALRHPTWKMGPRITVDSATMMNKALEIAEAVVLFDVPPEKIRVVLHPQSVVHSMVEFRDGSVMAQMSRPDMRLPILFAMAYPDRPRYEAVRFSIADFGTLTFRDPDPRRYPALELGHRVARDRGVAGAVLNAADEAAVEAFLAGRIRFPEIAERVRRTLDRLAPAGTAREATLDEILAADRRARTEATDC
ncbi:MAG: 1-deoxy-D-xylulose-5-phosphate reductoisomerase [Planctomycetes bacterium]|nr:1-deoxy-D-xylulose-5-phosphate reductoisomerase [Planctomycetota bacterium]